MRATAMSKATLAFGVDEALKSGFSTTARASDYSSAQLLREFVQQ
jgi:hypothetical protein